jgi:hypothetical protein
MYVLPEYTGTFKSYNPCILLGTELFTISAESRDREIDFSGVSMISWEGARHLSMFCFFLHCSLALSDSQKLTPEYHLCHCHCLVCFTVIDGPLVWSLSSFTRVPPTEAASQLYGT